MRTKRKRLLILVSIIGVFIAFIGYSEYTTKKERNRLKEIENSRYDEYVEAKLKKVREWNLSAEELMEIRDSINKTDEKLGYACCYVAAEKGNPYAQFVAGIMFMDGLLVRKNIQTAIEWFEKSANQGNSDAMFNLGYIYSHKDDGIKPDYKKALDYYRMAAFKGNKDAINNMALLYIEGKGVKDIEKGLETLKQLAADGDSDAAYNIGIMYYEGKGVKKDLKTAFEWMMKAADAGSVEAQYNVGVMYENGEGVSCDMNMAIIWYSIAAANGHVNAMHAYKDLRHYKKFKATAPD